MIKIAASHTLPDPPRDVWNALLDANLWAHCLPGCEGLTPYGDGRYGGAITVAGSPLAGRYIGTLIVDEAVEPQSYRLRVNGEGTGGTVHAHGRVTLHERNGETEVEVRGEMVVRGALAAISPRLLQSSARSQIRQNLERLEAAYQGLPVPAPPRPAADLEPGWPTAHDLAETVTQPTFLKRTVTVLAFLLAYRTIQRWRLRRLAQEVASILDSDRRPD